MLFRMAKSTVKYVDLKELAATVEKLADRDHRSVSAFLYILVRESLERRKK